MKGERLHERGVPGGKHSSQPAGLHVRLDEPFRKERQAQSLAREIEKGERSIRADRSSYFNDSLLAVSYEAPARGRPGRPVTTQASLAP
jgi:hypothetical protein